MSRPLLVPLDGSAAAERALPVAAALARRTAAPLRLVRVLPPDAPAVAWAPVSMAGAAEAALPPTALQRDAQAYLDGVAARLAAEGVDAAALVLVGPVVPTLLRDAAAADVGLVVMTSLGRGLSGTLLGSVARELARDAAVPVLMVRPAGEAPGAADRILVPLDGSAQDMAIVAAAAPLAAALAAELVLLRVVSPPAHRDRPTAVQLDRDALRRMKAEAAAYLAPIRDRLAASGLAVRTLVTVDERPGDAIMAAAAEEGVRLIAMATHGRRGLDRLLHGSVAEGVLRRADTDVLLYHP